MVNIERRGALDGRARGAAQGGREVQRGHYLIRGGMRSSGSSRCQATDAGWPADRLLIAATITNLLWN